jgi:probable rRNA maturation factor
MSSIDGSSVTFRRVPADIRPRAITLFALQFRGKDYATDVLSFPSGRALPLGDLAISAARARAQAREFGHTTEDELRILMLHGVLHLLGMDHETDGGRIARAEGRWRRALGLPNGLIERAQS